MKILMNNCKLFRIRAAQNCEYLEDFEKMLRNEYLVAEIGVDRAENEPYVRSDVSRLVSGRRVSLPPQTRARAAATGTWGRRRPRSIRRGTRKRSRTM